MQLALTLACKSCKIPGAQPQPQQMQNADERISLCPPLHRPITSNVQAMNIHYTELEHIQYKYLQLQLVNYEYEPHENAVYFDVPILFIFVHFAYIFKNNNNS